MTGPVRVVVFASGSGSNLQALLDHPKNGSWEIVGLVTNNRDAGALERARLAGVPTRVIPTKERTDQEVERDTLDALHSWRTDLVLLAGYMRLIPPGVVHAFNKRILNVHPALLPAFGGPGMYGMNVHKAVIEAGEKTSGVTIHLVDEEYDRGAIVAQREVPVLLGDSSDTLAARVLAAEHELYPLTVDRVCSDLLAGVEPNPLPIHRGDTG